MPRPSNDSRRERLQRDALSAIGVGQNLLRDGRLHDYAPIERRNDEIIRRYMELRDLWLEERHNGNLIVSWPDGRCNHGRRESLAYINWPMADRQFNSDAMVNFRQQYLERSGALRQQQQHARNERDRAQLADRAAHIGNQRHRRALTANSDAAFEQALRQGAVPFMDELHAASAMFATLATQQTSAVRDFEHRYEARSATRRLDYDRDHPIRPFYREQHRWIGNLQWLSPIIARGQQPNEWALPSYLPSREDDELVVLPAERSIMRHGDEDGTLYLFAAPITRNAGVPGNGTNRYWRQHAWPGTDYIMGDVRRAYERGAELPSRLQTWLNWVVSNQLHGGYGLLNTPSGILDMSNHARPYQPRHMLVVTVAGYSLELDGVRRPLMFRRQHPSNRDSAQPWWNLVDRFWNAPA